DLPVPAARAADPVKVERDRILPVAPLLDLPDRARDRLEDLGLLGLIVGRRLLRRHPLGQLVHASSPSPLEMGSVPATVPCLCQSLLCRTFSRPSPDRDARGRGGPAP